MSSPEHSVSETGQLSTYPQESSQRGTRFLQMASWRNVSASCLPTTDAAPLTHFSSAM